MNLNFKIKDSIKTGGKYIFTASVLLFAVCCFSMAAAAQKKISISEAQGDKNVSPYAEQMVKLTGIVTARVKSGFYIQTPDDKTDRNPATSEGIYVFTKTEPGGDAAIGNLVTVTGKITEYTPKSEPMSLPLTELSFFKGKDTISVESKGNALPKPIVLTAADTNPDVADALERFEGMRVTVNELTAVSPTGGRVDDKNASSDSNGTFYAVVKGLPRPFRSAGYDLFDYIFLTEKDQDKFKKDYPKLPIFDDNPERLRIESTAQLGAQAIETTSFAEIKNLTGVMSYAYRAYAILVDADNKPLISGLVKASPLPAPNERQFSVAGMNLENFFDDQDDPAIKEDIVTSEAFERRLKKISMAIRGFMMSPDVIGTIEVENQAALERLAEHINKDAVAAGNTDPKYQAYLIDGNDGRGIDSGFLVKSSRVKKIEIQQFGKDDEYKNPIDKDSEFLNDRPPLMLRASIDDPQTNKPLEFTVVVNHLKSLRGYDDPKQMENVRLKKKLQAEFLARWVQEQTNEKSE